MNNDFINKRNVKDESLGRNEKYMHSPEFLIYAKCCSQNND